MFTNLDDNEDNVTVANSGNAGETLTRDIIDLHKRLSIPVLLHILFSFYAATVTLNKNGQKVSISGVNGRSRYDLSQFHFHWGDGAVSFGSEHQLNGRTLVNFIYMLTYSFTIT